MNKKSKLPMWEVKPAQLTLVDKIKSLGTKNLYYLTVQQSLEKRVLTLKELKKFIKKGMKMYLKHSGIKYSKGLEDTYFQYVTIFETTKDFYLSQHENQIVDENIQMGLHFHLFITSNYLNVSYPKLMEDIKKALTFLKHKADCISKFDHRQIIKLEDNFYYYHAKQLMHHYSPEMILTNI